eukprot:273917-Chlamydomonas_euryale.AAC.8
MDSRVDMPSAPRLPPAAALPPRGRSSDAVCDSCARTSVVLSSEADRPPASTTGATVRDRSAADERTACGPAPGPAPCDPPFAGASSLPPTSAPAAAGSGIAGDMDSGVSVQPPAPAAAFCAAVATSIWPPPPMRCSPPAGAPPAWPSALACAASGLGAADGPRSNSIPARPSPPPPLCSRTALPRPPESPSTPPPPSPCSAAPARRIAHAVMGAAPAGPLAPACMPPDAPGVPSPAAPMLPSCDVLPAALPPAPPDLAAPLRSAVLPPAPPPPPPWDTDCEPSSPASTLPGPRASDADAARSCSTST